MSTTSSSPTNRPSRGFNPIRALLAAFALATLAGCIADTAEDTDLPWATNKGWEGLAPISPEIMDRYD